MKASIRLGLLLLLALFVPSAANAGDWWDVWGFFDQLSGPGPFNTRRGRVIGFNPEIRIPLTLLKPLYLGCPGETGEAALQDKRVVAADPASRIWKCKLSPQDESWAREKLNKNIEHGGVLKNQFLEVENLITLLKTNSRASALSDRDRTFVFMQCGRISELSDEMIRTCLAESEALRSQILSSQFTASKLTEQVDGNVPRVLRNIAQPSALFIDLRFSWLKTYATDAQGNPKPRFLDSTAPNRFAPVDVFAFDPALMYRMGHGVDIGTGLTIMHFSGEGFSDFNRVGLIFPRMSFTPGGLIKACQTEIVDYTGGCKYAHLINFSLDGVLLAGFSGKDDFGDPTTKYDTTHGHEYVFRFGMQLDLGALSGVVYDLFK